MNYLTYINVDYQNWGYGIWIILVVSNLSIGLSIIKDLQNIDHEKFGNGVWSCKHSLSEMGYDIKSTVHRWLGICIPCNIFYSFPNPTSHGV